ncbi:uncharacterized protein N7483_000615 [Penicillium malachiteum]|uniref:uncharacterized protein n=1 Tax=Penicillium malachiteum TaxID=1324776 RepID=UPI002548BE4A|nr:uncharacterized protein N7483_000615 [Penicillium malachiteum]KAJ5735490.1 hypothetical protein N7483_000615 [Penicillium malachiteum]
MWCVWEPLVQCWDKPGKVTSAELLVPRRPVPDYPLAGSRLTMAIEFQVITRGHGVPNPTSPLKAMPGWLGYIRAWGLDMTGCAMTGNTHSVNMGVRVIKPGRVGVGDFCSAGEDYKG